MWACGDELVDEEKTGILGLLFLCIFLSRDDDNPRRVN